MATYVITSMDGIPCEKVCEGWEIVRGMLDEGHTIKFRPYCCTELARKHVSPYAEFVREVPIKQELTWEAIEKKSWLDALLARNFSDTLSD